MMGHKICFYEEIWIIIPKLSLLPLRIWSIVVLLRQRKLIINEPLEKMSCTNSCLKNMGTEGTKFFL